jgi:uncharacterized protein YecT (DUF1311 family)
MTTENIMKRQFRLGAILILAASPAFAQSQSAMNADAAKSAAAADRRLNTQYAATMAKLSVPSRTLLRNAQRSWIGFRDLQCKFEASAVQGGSAYPMVQSGCLARLTDERTRQLAAYGTCQEGDLACPR